ncbi:hypothetical protein KEM52_004893, partial [Ascosphaera acerosa]
SVATVASFSLPYTPGRKRKAGRDDFYDFAGQARAIRQHRFLRVPESVLNTKNIGLLEGLADESARVAEYYAARRNTAEAFARMLDVSSDLGALPSGASGSALDEEEGDEDDD